MSLGNRIATIVLSVKFFQNDTDTSDFLHVRHDFKQERSWYVVNNSKNGGSLSTSGSVVAMILF